MFNDEVRVLWLMASAFDWQQPSASNVDYALPFYMENAITRMGFMELITEHTVGLGPPLS